MQPVTYTLNTTNYRRNYLKNKSDLRISFSADASKNKIKTLPENKSQSNPFLKTAIIAGGAFTSGAIAVAIFKRPETAQKLEKAIQEAVKPYQDTLLENNQKTNAIINAKSLGEIKDNLLKLTREEINNYKLNYNPTNPQKYLTDNKTVGTDLFSNYQPTKNRANMRPLNLPEFKKGSSWSFKMPETSNITAVKESPKPFTPTKNVQTNISLDYADSVKWSDDKVTRDILQNFYDGHGQTLDGVKLDIKYKSDGKYKVRIEGKGIYSPEKAVYLGETSKGNNASAAGNYGEGLKMTTLKLLKDAGCEKVITGSDNWQVVFNVNANGIGNKKILNYSLDKVEPFPGSYFEFETDKPPLIESLVKTLNRFNHSLNKDFECPDFENKLFGIKYLPNTEKGGVYIAGQKFEYNGTFEGVENATIFFNFKPPNKAKINGIESIIFDPSRDRISLKAEDLTRLSEYFGAHEETSEKELAHALFSLKKLWTGSEQVAKKGGESILKGLLYAASQRGLNLKFPDEYIAMPPYNLVSKGVIDDLRNNGYKICDSKFGQIGMVTVTDFLKQVRNHQVFTPTEKEVKKIGILQKAIQQLRPYIKNDSLFTEKELSPQIYLFKAKDVKESKIYNNTLAEAITKVEYDNVNFVRKNKSIGFWIDRNYFGKTSFSEILSTALHEMTHKSGGDGSEEFSYKLTEVLEKEIASRLEDEKANIELKNLKTLWDELSSK